MEMDEDKDIPVGGVYTLRNKYDDLFLTVVGKRPWCTGESGNPENLGVTCPTARIEARHKLKATIIVGQTWQVFQVDHGRYIVASKASGLCLSLEGNRSTPRTDVVQRPLQEGNTSQTWIIKFNHSIANVHYYTIQNASSRLFLKSVIHGRKKYPIIQQWPPMDDNVDERNSRLWAFQTKEIMVNILDDDIPVVRNVDDRNITQLLFWKPPKPSITEQVLVGRVVIPYPLINDPEYSRLHQALDCPYYVLRRYGYWRLLFFYDHSGLTDTRERRSYPVGLMSNNHQELERITGMSFSAKKAAFCFNALSKFIRNKMANRLKVNFCHRVGDGETVEIEHKFFFGPAAARKVDVHWCREDRYELVRYNNTKVLEWTTRDRNTTGGDVFDAAML